MPRAVSGDDVGRERRRLARARAGEGPVVVARAPRDRCARLTPTEHTVGASAHLAIEPWVSRREGAGRNTTIPGDRARGLAPIEHPPRVAPGSVNAKVGDGVGPLSVLRACRPGRARLFPV